MVQQSDQKLLVIIVSDSDADRLMQILIGRGYPATKIGSTGGFLRKGNTTILSGVEAEDVDDVIAAIREVCYAHTEYVPVQSLPFVGEGNVVLDPMEVRVGGAVIFVLSVERFEKT